MAKYLMLKHYRGAPASVNDVPMDQWTPQEVDAHMQYMNDFAKRLESTGEYVDSQALSPDGTFVRFDGEGRPPVTDGASAEDAVQDALITAALTWPEHRPADPKRWLVTVAWRKFVDAHRSDASRRDREERVAVEPPPGPTQIADDTLQLFFLCAHPS